MKYWRTWPFDPLPLNREGVGISPSTSFSSSSGPNLPFQSEHSLKVEFVHAVEE